MVASEVRGKMVVWAVLGMKGAKVVRTMGEQGVLEVEESQARLEGLG